MATREEKCPVCGKELCKCPTVNRGSFAKYVDKRADIREVIDHYADDGCLYPDKTCEFFKGSWCVSDDEAYRCLMKRLDEIGVVIKVDRELPFQVACPQCHEIFDFPNEGLDKAGYVAVESIIEESK